MKIAKIMTLAAFLFSVSSLAIADESLSMDDLLNKVKAGRAADNQDNKRREQEFIQQKQEQERMIREAKAEIAALESKSAEMEKQFNENELAVEEKGNSATKD